MVAVWSTGTRSVCVTLHLFLSVSPSSCPDSILLSHPSHHLWPLTLWSVGRSLSHSLFQSPICSALPPPPSLHICLHLSVLPSSPSILLLFVSLPLPNSAIPWLPLRSHPSSHCLHLSPSPTHCFSLSCLSFSTFILLLFLCSPHYRSISIMLLISPSCLSESLSLFCASLSSCLSICLSLIF